MHPQISPKNRKILRAYIRRICAQINSTGTIDPTFMPLYMDSIKILSMPENKELAQYLGFSKILKAVRSALQTSHLRVKFAQFDYFQNAWYVVYSNGSRDLITQDWRTGIQDNIDHEFESRVDDTLQVMFN